MTLLRQRLTTALGPWAIAICLVAVSQATLWAGSERAPATPNQPTPAATPVSSAHDLCLRETQTVTRVVTITTSADGGAGSLRQALLNQQPGDLVRFDPVVFPPTRPVSITLVGDDLPPITVNHLTIDASDARVILDGQRLSRSGIGLLVNGAKQFRVHGLRIMNFPQSGLILMNGAQEGCIGGDRGVGAASLGQGNVIGANGGDGIELIGTGTFSNVVQGNYIGVDARGAIAGNHTYGVFLRDGAHDNQIGGSTSGTGNLISGNVGAGIYMGEAGTRNNHVVGNLIGTDKTGTRALGNGYGGIVIQGGPTDNIIGGEPSLRNIISGNEGPGIHIYNAANNTVQGNYIGTDGSATQPLPNMAAGIQLDGGATDNYIGGMDGRARNVVSGNVVAGIQLKFSSRNQVQGNYIGVAVDGKTALPNRGYGVALGYSSHHNLIGGADEGAWNIISGNDEAGVLLQDRGTDYNRVQGNYIGVDATGIVALGNKEAGVQLRASARNNLVGGLRPGEGNVIAGNLEAGVGMDLGATGNTVQGNAIGTDKAHQVALPNLIGVYIKDGSANLIGAATPGGQGGNWIATNTAYGLLISSGHDNIVQGNTFDNNGGIPAQWPVGNRVEANTFSHHKTNLAVVTGGALTADETWARQGELTTYIMTEDDLLVPAGRSLTLDQGVTVQFSARRDGTPLGTTIEGTLRARGSSDKPILLTCDQRYDYPRDGCWRGLTLGPNHHTTLEHTLIEFAEIGLTQRGGALALDGVTIGASHDTGLVFQGGQLSLNSSAFAANQKFGLDNQTTAPIDARGTWWGSDSGPQTANGAGDALHGGPIVTSPWTADPRPRDFWYNAPILNPGPNHFVISDTRDLQWFRLPVLTPYSVVTVTLGELRQDYDLFVFSGLEQAGLSPDDIGHIQDIAGPEDTGHIQDIPGERAKPQHCSPAYLGQVADLSKVFSTAALLDSSCEVGTQEERVGFGAWDRTGWYYVLVAGHNGTASPVPYALNVTINRQGSDTGVSFRPPHFKLPDATDPSHKTLIVTYRSRLERSVATPADVPDLMVRLSELAARPDVAGVILDLGATPLDPDRDLPLIYSDWDAHPASVPHANHVAASVKALLDNARAAYPQLENIILVGDDRIIPFRRVPDEVSTSDESEYQVLWQATSPVGASFKPPYAYFLTDNYYAAVTTIPWRGHGLSLPDFAIGRLVEEPADMISQLDAYLHPTPATGSTALVTGYDFLLDEAEAIAGDFRRAGMTVTSLISDSWQTDDLQRAWLDQRHEVSSINAHFDHWEAIPADVEAGVLTTQDVISPTYSANLRGTIVFTVGCHAGLAVPDKQIDDARDDSGGLQKLDFAQALQKQGVTYIANTGYGYGDADAIGYSERLMQSFAYHLARGQTVGQALRQAKQDYFAAIGVRSLTPFDEKVLSVATLYGLPMRRISSPGVAEGAAAKVPSPKQADLVPAPPSLCPAPLICRQTHLAPVYETLAVSTTQATGVYYTVNGLTRIVAGQPIQPLITTTITISDARARGAIFEGGTYTSDEDFDPVVTRIITQTTRTQTTPIEPTFTSAGWTPSIWNIIHSRKTDAGLRQSLVVTPAQYHPKTARQGVERRFTAMTYTVYYSSTRDVIPPSIWQVRPIVHADRADLEVEVTDYSQVARVVVAYTHRDGVWHTFNLTRTTPSVWTAAWPQVADLEYFVQAVDYAGNVAVHDNREEYFHLRPSYLFLPWLAQRR